MLVIAKISTHVITELSGDWENVCIGEKSLDRMDFSSLTFLLCSANRDRIGPYNNNNSNNNKKRDRIGPGFEWMGLCMFSFSFLMSFAVMGAE